MTSMMNNPFLGSRRSEGAARAVHRDMPTHGDFATDRDSPDIIQHTPKGNRKQSRKKEVSIRDAYALQNNEKQQITGVNGEPASEMLRPPRTNVDDLATADGEEFLVLMDVDGSQMGRTRSLISDASSQNNINEARNADAPVAWPRRRKTRSNGSNSKIKQDLSIVDPNHYFFLEQREPDSFACFRDDNTVMTISADSSRREIQSSAGWINRGDDSERTDHHDGDTPSRSPCIPLCGEFVRDGRNFRELDEEIEVVATKLRKVSQQAEDARPLPPPPSPSAPKRNGLTSFFSGRMKKMEQARQRRRKLDQKKMEKDEKKKKGKKLGFRSSKLNKSTEDIQKQIATTRHEVLALANELRSRGLPDSQDEHLSSSEKALSKHLVMARINVEEEQLFIADFDPKHFENDEPPQDPRPSIDVCEGPPSLFPSPDEVKLNRRSFLKQLSSAGTKRNLQMVGDEQTEQFDLQQRQQQEKEKVESGDQLFMADFDPRNFETTGASFTINEAEDHDEPATEGNVEAGSQESKQQQHKDLQRSPSSPQAQPLPDPNAAAGLLLTKLQEQRRATEQRLNASTAAKHQNNGTDLDPKQIERKVRTLHELTHLQDNSKLARSVSAIAIEASILEKVVKAIGSQDTFEETRTAFEEALEQTDSYIKHLASLSGEASLDVGKEAPALKNAQLSKQEIDIILEDVSTAVAACDVVSSIKEELNKEPKTTQSTSTRKPKLTQREYQEALAEHEKQLKQDALCAITEEDTIEEDSANGIGSPETKRSELPSIRISSIREEDSNESGIISTSTSSTDNDEGGDGDDDSSDISEETDASDEDGLLSFDESLNSAISNCAESAKSTGRESASFASINPADAPAASGCFWWSCWPGSAPKSIKQLEQSNSGNQVTRLTNDSERNSLATVNVESMRSVSTRGSYESEMNSIRHISSAPTSQSFDEEDDLLDRIEYGLCGNRR